LSTFSVLKLFHHIFISFEIKDENAVFKEFQTIHSSLNKILAGNSDSIYDQLQLIFLKLIFEFLIIFDISKE